MPIVARAADGADADGVAVDFDALDAALVDLVDVFDVAVGRSYGFPRSGLVSVGESRNARAPDSEEKPLRKDLPTQFEKPISSGTERWDRRGAI